MLLGAAVIIVPLTLVLGRGWQEDVRELMGMDSQTGWAIIAILLVGVVVAVLILVISRFIRGLGRMIVHFIQRWIPDRIAAIAGVVITAVIVVGLVQGFLLDPTVDALNSTFSVVNDGTEPGIVQPTVPERSGSQASLVSWDDLGIKGRDFIGSGPTREQISEFNGGIEAQEPIRVYVGLKSADSIEDRVDLAMQELDRTNAWDREYILVFATTGTGWVNPRGVDPLEYMHRGDTAIVALRYSYLPSFVQFIVDTEPAADSGRQMIAAVRARLDPLPADDRPKLLLYGESLGSYGTEQAFADVDDMIEQIDGATLVGPTFYNDIHTDLTGGREPESPFWRPVYDAGRHVRFAVDPADLTDPATEWAEPRIVYLQNSSDPITYFDIDLLWSQPAWLDDPRGPDVSSSMFWIPVVTFWQTVADLARAADVPAGHGHRYGANPADAWVAITMPDGWTDEDTNRLRAIIGHE